MLLTGRCQGYWGCLMSRTMAMLVRYESLYISKALSARQQRKMTKYFALELNADISYFV